MSKQKVSIEIVPFGKSELYYSIWYHKDGIMVIDIASENEICKILSPERYQSFQRGRRKFLITENKIIKSLGISAQ